MGRKMSYKTRITLHTEGDFEGHGFGKGIEQLLLGVDRYGSLNRAAKALGMAYSKAWNILRLTEMEFEIQLINRDGAHGSTLTDEGRTFLAHYQEMIDAANQAAKVVFNNYFC